MEKRELYGIYDTEAQLEAEMDRLRLQGYKEEDMFIVSNRDDQYTLHRGYAGTSDDMEGASWWDKFKAFMTGEDLVNDNFRRLGIDDAERDRYYNELRNGKYLLYVDSDYDTYYNGSTLDAAIDDEKRLELHEERLNIDKNRVKTGEVNVNKNVHIDEQTIDVPVEREEVYIERRPVNREVGEGGTANFSTNGTLDDEGTIHIPITEEQVEVTKKDVVTEEIVVGKRKVVDTETITDTVRREEAEIDDTTARLNDDTDNRYHGGI
ncbi:YsnF/AvaK domain-containing protein [Ureibacillus aquaedulcis]|uniref:DUF2382 domain-containing protein n=1 Tax=Ureibacillus aquaedulcis TaxID=3058421 RepID=A0ABT8GU24_9BACL|nr:DUF2382 domain-containing protein [Ureibacillus sp. BA0131]MDN4494916.1 DUF2382 domain-containing protein [Ureibacillus sp. BA0131]